MINWSGTAFTRSPVALGYTPAKATSSATKAVKQPTRKPVATPSSPKSKLAAVKYAPAPITIPATTVAKGKTTSTTTTTATLGTQTTQTASAKAAAYVPPSDFGISGYVYLDSNKNGKKDFGEWAIGNATLGLIGPNGQYLGFTQTKSDGSYRFGGLTEYGTVNGVAAKYSLVEFLPTGYEPTGSATGKFLNLSGSTMTLNSAWYGTAGGGGNTQIASIYLPDPVSDLGWTGWTINDPKYAVTDYNFCVYKSVKLPASKRYYLLSTAATIWAPPVPVPEPGTLSLLAAGGLGALGWAGLRRRKS